MMDDKQAIPTKAVRRVKWSREPEMLAWMRKHDDGCSRAELSRRFNNEFGFLLTLSQIGQFRGIYGQTFEQGHKGISGAPLPVGTERIRQGYVYVKVRADAKVSLSRDNWELKSRYIYEKTHGVKLTKDEVVLFGDGDSRNFDPENLVAIPRRLIVRVNSRSEEWYDADSLKAVVASEALNIAVIDARSALPRTCGVCGRQFVVPKKDRHKLGDSYNIRTCPSCLSQGHKAKGTRRAKDGPAIAKCVVCGAEFVRESKTQRRCSACIAEAPTTAPAVHKKMKERTK